MAITLKDLIPKVLSSDEWHVMLAQRWNEVVGNLKTRIRLEKIYQDTVVIGVYEYHWMQELYLMSPLLCSSINTFLGSQRINHIRLVLVEDKKKREKRIKPKPLLRPGIVPFTSIQKKALLVIKDEDFKQALINYWQRCCARENID